MKFNDMLDQASESFTLHQIRMNGLAFHDKYVQGMRSLERGERIALALQVLIDDTQERIWGLRYKLSEASRLVKNEATRQTVLARKAAKAQAKAKAKAKAKTVGFAREEAKTVKNGWHLLQAARAGSVD